MFILRRKIYNLLSALLVVMLSAGVASCGSDDEDSPVSKGLQGWYTDLSEVAKQSDFTEFNTAINSNEVLSSYYYGGQRHNYVASYSLFVDSSTGFFSDTSSNLGRLRFKIQSTISAIRIVDDNTLLDYGGELYAYGKNTTEELIYKFYAGPIFQNMAYYGTPTYKTFTRIDNKLILSDGTVYTVVDGGLIKDGGSVKMSKYDPTKTF